MKTQKRAFHLCFPKCKAWVEVFDGDKRASFAAPSFKTFCYTVASLLNKRLMLTSSFRCDQIYKYEIHNFGHTLLCYLSPT